MNHIPEPSRVLCSFGEAGTRSWTDISSNHTYLRQLDHSVLANVVLGDLPLPILFEFLHETTHHACLNTPVGYALALLDEESRYGTEDPSETALLQLRIDTVLTLYRAWMEGLALFAEFNASPGHTTVLSEPLTRALHLFLAFEARTDQMRNPSDPSEDIFAMLYDLRRTEFAQQRKQDILVSGWRGQSRYLQGYMAVKNFARWAEAAHPPLFADKDFLLSYLINHLFSDITMVDLLLRPAGDPDTLALIQRQFSVRLAQLPVQERLAVGGQRLEDRMATPDHAGDPDRLEVLAALDDNLEAVRVRGCGSNTCLESAGREHACVEPIPLDAPSFSIGCAIRA